MGNLADTRDACVEKSVASGDKAFKGVNAGTLHSDFAGTAFVDRIVDIVRLEYRRLSNVESGTDGVGPAAIDCKSSDTCRRQLRKRAGQAFGSRCLGDRRRKWNESALAGRRRAPTTRAAGADCFSTACGGE